MTNLVNFDRKNQNFKNQTEIWSKGTNTERGRGGSKKYFDKELIMLKKYLFYCKNKNFLE